MHRRATVNQLDMLGIAPYMDLVVCGNDQGESDLWSLIFEF